MRSTVCIGASIIVVALTGSACSGDEARPTALTSATRAVAAVENPDGHEVCPALMASKASGLQVTLPCAVGARIIKATELSLNGERCARVAYVANQYSNRSEEIICTTDHSADGPSVRWP